MRIALFRGTLDIKIVETEPNNSQYIIEYFEKDKLQKKYINNENNEKQELTNEASKPTVFIHIPLHQLKKENVEIFNLKKILKEEYEKDEMNTPIMNYVCFITNDLLDGDETMKEYRETVKEEYKQGLRKYPEFNNPIVPFVLMSTSQDKLSYKQYKTLEKQELLRKGLIKQTKGILTNNLINYMVTWSFHYNDSLVYLRDIYNSGSDEFKIFVTNNPHKIIELIKEQDTLIKKDGKIIQKKKRTNISILGEVEMGLEKNHDIEGQRKRIFREGDFNVKQPLIFFTIYDFFCNKLPEVKPLVELKYYLNIYSP